ncbi:hypothetical protein [Leifsonia sp. Root112D2]|uniref:hypothetical protein n=1 Tax=Leifsonia sp. Root112D2 TaxID=1736426 RepID=UPI0006FF2AA6|nr:hypothetical protein [Leifsonia sp. Root112D2]KQV07329.1 hypothetical protein ASC63_08490 [Leifsonia sp. Root112D2]
MTQETPPTVSRLQRSLAYAIAAVVILSLVSIAALLIGTASGIKAEGFSSGLWPAILLLPDIGFPLALILMVILLIISMRNRSKHNREQR